MVLEEVDRPQDGSQDAPSSEPLPNDDVDPYAGDHSPTVLDGRSPSYIPVNSPPHQVYVNLNNVPRIWTFIGRVDHPQSMINVIRHVCDQASRTLGRPVNQQEADALAYHFGQALRIESYGTPIGLSIANVMAYRGIPNMRFPGYTPSEKFNAEKFGPLKGPRAKIMWHVMRVGAYWLAGALLGQAFFSLYAPTSAAAGMSMDPRLRELNETRGVKYRRPIEGSGERDRTAGPRNGETMDMAKQRGKAQDAQDAWRRRRQESTGQSSASSMEGDDMSPTGGAFGAEYVDFGSAHVTDTGMMSDYQSRRSSQRLEAQQRADYAERNEPARSRPAPRPQRTDENSQSGQHSSTPKSGGSAWERLRQQAASGGQQHSGTKGNAPSRSSPSAESFSFLSSEEDKQLARSEGQRDFDARLEQERQGKDFDDRSSGRRWYHKPRARYRKDSTSVGPYSSDTTFASSQCTQPDSILRDAGKHLDHFDSATLFSNMENADEEDDVKLVKASARLLADLEHELPKLLWKRSAQGKPRQAHTKVKTQDLDRIVNLIEPFQGEPQLLDAKLNTFLPPIVDAYLDSTGRIVENTSQHRDIETALCCLLYTFCKVRGHKVVVGFLSNEPRRLQPVLEAIEATLVKAPEQPTSWQVPYVLLLWLSHLLLTPFDLDSISTAKGPLDSDSEVIPQLPALASRVLRIGLFYISAPTKAQDAAATLLARLCIRPDILPLQLADWVVKQQLPKLRSAQNASNIYEALGSLRLVTGIAAASELVDLVPPIYQTCAKIFDDPSLSFLSSNAVAKKMAIKLFRNVSILSLRSAASAGPLTGFLQTTGVLENVIDYLLRSLAEKDTPVRYAAAKAISLIVLELDAEMGHEVIQAVLDSYKEDMPRTTSIVDFSTADPLRWHGLTLALGHSLFKRSASPEQLPDIFDALISALQFQQRTATGTLLGTNVRDAANFGIWSLARRYATAELLRVRVQGLHKSNQVGTGTSIIQVLATQLVLSACLDPAGNIRRGSSAALQELVGRHPDQVSHGISLVQRVDYQAVSLRRRAMKDVAYGAAHLHSTYADALAEALFDWRGLWSADVASRQSAASALPLLRRAGQPLAKLLQKTVSFILMCDSREVENLHGYALAAAELIDEFSSALEVTDISTFFKPLDKLKATLHDFTSRLLRSELPGAIARLATAVWKRVYHSLSKSRESAQVHLVHMVGLEDITERLLWRHEQWILDQLPELVRILLYTKRLVKEPLHCIGAQTLCKQVAVEGAKSTKHGIGRAIALGTLAILYNDGGLIGDKASAAVKTLCNLMSVMNIDWRITAASALALVIESTKDGKSVDISIAELICMTLLQGLNDYTIDERGDVGSLVRLQCIACFRQLLDHGTDLIPEFRSTGQPLKHEIARLSLEKLDRVRLQAALCRDDLNTPTITDVASVSSMQYFRAALRDIVLPETLEPGKDQDDALARQEALLKGCISCAGVAAEPLLQASRQVLTALLLEASLESLQQLMTAFTAVLSQQVSGTANTHPTLELLAFLLDTQIPRRLSGSTFRWRSLLSVVQKSHHKSNDIPKILAAVHVYMGLADVAAIRDETLKKLVSMLKTNPYPRVRAAVAEVLFLVSEDEGLKMHDWARPPSQFREVTEVLYERLVAVGRK
ncbi:hypothetical protein AC579_7491 [Pseudocercospora musae]|uniref:Uncharacterized protein n=1 Tax=Pseudocercospora musae TaxID=113226 RepID=A0A139ID77_9PEZI|nr:hypothetical protein AC579_7491 [Pseudocercospora musae]